MCIAHYFTFVVAKICTFYYIRKKHGYAMQNGPKKEKNYHT